MKVLFGVFDWGLGHATRDSPLIEALLKRGDRVDIISTGRALKLLKMKFGRRCRYFDIPLADKPAYTASRLFPLQYLKSLPKISLRMQKTRKVVEKIMGRERYDKVVSDYRFDVYDNAKNTFFISHHFGFKVFMNVPGFVEWIEKKIELKLWKNSKYILTLDFDNEKDNLTGKLGHRMKFFDRSKVRYIGILSHVKKRKLKKDIDYFISISGPEPQRTVLEEKLLPQLDNLPGNIVVTLGKPESSEQKLNGRIKIYSFLNSKKQEEMLNRAKFVIARSAFTTMMEFCELGIKKALLIPTPNLPEQEYLADYYEEKGYFHHVDQDELDLLKDIKKARRFKGFRCFWNTRESVRRFIKLITEK